MVKTASNPGGLAKDVFDGLQAQTANNRAQFFRDILNTHAGNSYTRISPIDGRFHDDLAHDINHGRK